MLPWKAMRLPMPRMLRTRLATNATPTPYHGPSTTAQRMFTMCCTGAHLLPRTGKDRRLPTTATAHSTPASASLWVVVRVLADLFIIKKLLQIWDDSEETGRFRQRFPPCMARLADAIRPRRKQSVETCWSPLTPEHGFPSLLSGPDPGRSPSIRSRPDAGLPPISSAHAPL